jgi:hypothetical protein
MLEQRSLKAAEAVLTIQQKAIENFVVCDLPGFAHFADQLPTDKRAGSEQWWGGMTYDQSLLALRHGDLSGVAASDKLLREMEALIPVSRSWRSINSVIGACPNVPQYLAGNPYNMRLKRRSATATAPLSIFAELVASARISTATCLQRGATILALVRLLANLRPVELWCVIAIGELAIEYLCPARYCAAGLGAKRTRLDAPKCLSGARIQITRTRLLWPWLERGLGFRRSRAACSNGSRQLSAATKAGLRCSLHSAGSSARSLPDRAGQMAAHHDRAARRRTAGSGLIDNPASCGRNANEGEKHSKSTSRRAHPHVHVRARRQDL